MFKSDLLFGCRTTVTVNVEVKERRIKLLQINLEGRGYGLLTRKTSRNVLVEVEQKSGYALIHMVLLLIVFGANSERHFNHGLHRYSELLIFVVFPYVSILTTSKMYQNFTLGMLFKTAHFRVIFHHIMFAALSQRQQYI
jgi:hypothetical protein